MHLPFPSHRRAVFLAAFLAAASSTPSARGTVLLDQTIPVQRGWNAVYVEVAPTGTLSQIFAGWPAESVGLYDPASFLSTRQQTASAASQGMTDSPIAMWHRDHPDASDASTLPAGTVCMFFNTNPAVTSLSLRGVPAAPRTTWHLTGPKKPYNFFGVTLQPGATVTSGDCLDGFPGIKSLSGIYRVSGTNAVEPPVLLTLRSTTKISDGTVLLVPSSEISDWTGTLFVSPRDGLDFGMDATKRILTVRNDSTRARTAAIELVPPAVPVGRDLLPALHLRDTAVALTNAAWVSPSSSLLASKTLAPGETWKMEFGLDRSLFDDDIRGTPFGAVLRVTDDGGASKIRVDVPIEGAATGKSSAGNAWPGGLWVADIAFDEVNFADETGFTPAGGVLKARLPVHIDAAGNTRLLQRVVAAGETAADGTLSYTLYAGNAEVPSTAREALRISSAVLPTETPVVESTFFFAGVFGFAFTVAGDGATSLLRHPLHPQHDGLRWDFATPAPSGDDFANYKGTVKPETFSVSNNITLMMDMNGGEATWNPEESKTGKCYWSLDGPRHEGTVTIRGDMSIHRVAPHTAIVFE